MEQECKYDQEQEQECKYDQEQEQEHLDKVLSVARLLELPDCLPQAAGARFLALGGEL